MFYYPCNKTDSLVKTIHLQYPPDAYIADTITSFCKQIQFYSVCDYACIDSLRWDFGDNFSGYNYTSISFNPIYNYNTDTFYVRLIIYGFCKTDTLLKPVYVNLPISNFTLGNDTLLCLDDTLVLGCNIISNVAADFSWQNGDTSTVMVVRHEGIYSVKINAGGCLFTDSIYVQYISPPAFQLPEDQHICEGQTFSVTVPYGSYSLIWNDGNTKNTRVLNTSGNYSVTAVNQCGTASDNFLLVVNNCECNLYIPNAFTPTGDGINDCFNVKYYCDFRNFHLFIYNRWGQLIFDTSNPDDCWDGKYLGNPVKSDLYVYLILYRGIDDKQEEIKRGTVTVVR